ncbi:MAG TPA: OsmC family protein [Longimicrobiaceae bacterium]|nr:OsmC family protein [Longimicrobiaceae bacterium]
MPEGVASPYPVEVVWEGGMRYRGGPRGGPTLLVDGAREAAPSPVDALVVSIAACSAIDVVEVLNKRRTPPASLRVRAEFSRAPEPPRRLTDVTLVYSVAADTERAHVERAIQLSFDRYCSVVHSLAPDTRLGWELELEGAAAAAG